MQTYNIKTDHFEGPFDLLLFFIQRDELDINDIPIAKITDDFLAYIRSLESLSLDVASEFILVAATLMRIKTKMLLPRKELDEQGNEIDPREEIAQKLLEYKMFKEVVSDFQQLEDIRSQKHYRGNITSELNAIADKTLVDVELESLSLYRLMTTFQKLLENHEYQKNKPVHRIIKFNYTIEEQQTFIFSQLKKNTKTQFEDIFQKLENRIHAVITFIALLELLNLQKVTITQGDGINNFWVESLE